jgi:hypothetical protein
MRTPTNTLLALALFAVPAAFAQTQTAQPTPAEVKTYHYWLHPKQGMVKVDKKTHVMVLTRRATQQIATPATRPAG